MLEVDIIIVNWNTGRLLARCLEVLQSLPEQNLLHKVYVVDNNSTDTSITVARDAIQQWNKVEFIQLTHNIGFAAANNLALQKIKDETHILLLNPDTEMQSGSLAALVSALEHHPKVGIVGPKLLNPDKSLQPSVRSFPTLSVLIALFLKLHGIASAGGFLKKYFQHGFDYSKEQEVDQVMGASFLIRRQTFQEVGALDDAFFVWFEEVDVCKRVKDKGWGVLYTPTASVVHHGGASFHQLVGLRKSWPMIRSALHYARKHLGMTQAFLLALLTPIAIALTLPATAAHTFKRKENTRRL
ncbi:MAG: glycosyltransferase family 2 protein [Candidatus Andersenbacteria bacterium]|nr:glycosyltransferase family 2 protein [Candidatus Andersenbacteria bacterium]MBI3250294.1 glycosyltransferase family 2 protein [Candidatus Andersenbacteria bacterium]